MPYDPNSWSRPGGGGARVLAQGQQQVRYSQQEMQELQQQFHQLNVAFDRLKKEPKLSAVVVEILDDGSMRIAMGPGNVFNVEHAPGVQVGDRVTIKRDTMQVIDYTHDEFPNGLLVTVEHVHGDVVQGQLLGMMKAFRRRRGKDGDLVPVKIGERVILDPSQEYVIGSLGMPPAKHTVAPTTAVSWEEIGGHESAKDALREAIELPITHKGLYRAYGQAPIKGVLLEGPPGTGKTLLAKAAATAIARAHGRDAAEGFIYVRGPELLNKYVGETESAIRAIFAAARTHKLKNGYPAVVCMDEADALLGRRDRQTTVGMNATIVPQFLAEMDGLDESAAMMIILTNRADMLDPAVVRDGRVDRRVKVGRPSAEDSRAIFDIHLRRRPISNQNGLAGEVEPLVSFAIEQMFADKRVIKDLGGDLKIRMRDFMSGAMIAGIVEQATALAIRRDISAGRKDKASGITIEDMAQAIAISERSLHHIDHSEVTHEIVERARAVIADAERTETESSDESTAA